LRYANQGHPDIAVFYDDLYHGCSNGHWAVIEQLEPFLDWLNLKVTCVESAIQPLRTPEDGRGVWFSNNDQAHYLACWPDVALLQRALTQIAKTA